MRKETALALLDEAGAADFIVAEALMGLYDAVASAGQWGNGASADIAALAGLPVVLVLDISGQSQTAAAVARGFAGFRPDVEIAGVILNRAAALATNAWRARASRQPACGFSARSPAARR